MGHEANGVGTSYLSDPNAMIGTFKMGSPLLNVTANRSMPKGAATVKWDAEGVEPAEFSVVKEGILNDFQTTREVASLLAPYYQKTGKPVRSNGCAGTYDPTTPLQQFNPNLVMKPGAQELSFDDLVRDTKKGLAIVGGYASADHQVLNGAGSGEAVYEIVDGKLGQTIANAEFIYRAPDLWKNLVAIGGPKSALSFGIDNTRGEGRSRMAHTVTAVPGKFKGVAITDPYRKA